MTDRGVMDESQAKPMKSISERSYAGRGPAARLHRSRLRSILREMSSFELPDEGEVAEFGCSTGLVLQQIMETVLSPESWQAFGFDVREENVAAGAQRGIPGASFSSFNLNRVDTSYAGRFDLVTCFETLEHTGDFRNAFENLYVATRQGGLIFVSVPNEKGLCGLAKYLGRKLLRRNAYEDFFDEQSELDYLMCLLLNRPLDRFRDPAAEGWGPHLGFDWKTLDRHVKEAYVESGKCLLLRRPIPAPWATVFYVLKKIS